jgi:uncharacterized membrane protein
VILAKTIAKPVTLPVITPLGIKKKYMATLMINMASVIVKKLFVVFVFICKTSTFYYAKKSAKKAKATVGSKFEAVFEGVSDEHEYLLKAKKKIWAPEIDGEILVNESEIENPVVGKLYKMTATAEAKDKVIARIDGVA